MTGFLTDIAEKHPKLSDKAFEAAEKYLETTGAKWSKYANKSLACFASFREDGELLTSYTSSSYTGDACHAKLATSDCRIIIAEKIACVAQPITDNGNWGTVDKQATTTYLNWIVSDDNPFAWILDDRCRSVDYIREKGAIFNVQGLPLGPCVHMFKVLRLIHEAPKRVVLFAKLVEDGISGRLAYLISQAFLNADCARRSSGHESSFYYTNGMNAVAAYMRGEVPPGRWEHHSSGNTMYSVLGDVQMFSDWTIKAYEAIKPDTLKEKVKENIDAWGVFNPPPVAKDYYGESPKHSYEAVLHFAKEYDQTFREQEKVAA